MGSQESSEGFYVTAEAAKAAVDALAAVQIHPQFPGYLAVLEAAAQAGRTEKLKVNFQKFFTEYLLIEGAPSERPFLQPFTAISGGRPQLFNKNVAGSYAPSSLRDVAPIRDVVDFEGRGHSVTQSLRSGHDALALNALAFKQKIPVDSLATFLLRDHRIPRVGSSEQDSVVDLFCKKFGYDLTDGDDAQRFDSLYRRDAETFRALKYAEE